MPILLGPLQVHIDLVVDASVLRLLDSDPGHLASLHNAETGLQETERPLIVHTEVVRNLTLLIQVDQLSIVEPCGVLVLHHVTVVCEGALSFFKRQNLY